MTYIAVLADTFRDFQYIVDIETDGAKPISTRGGVITHDTPKGFIKFVLIQREEQADGYIFSGVINKSNNLPLSVWTAVQNRVRGN